MNFDLAYIPSLSYLAMSVALQCNGCRSLYFLHPPKIGNFMVISVPAFSWLPCAMSCNR